MEKNQLSQMKSKTCHSVSTLCQRVCSEANLQPDQLQVLTKYTASDCPLTSFFPHIDAPLSQHGFPLHPSLLPCSAGLVTSKEDPSGSNKDTITGHYALQICLTHAAELKLLEVVVTKNCTFLCIVQCTSTLRFIPAQVCLSITTVIVLRQCIYNKITVNNRLLFIF